MGVANYLAHRRPSPGTPEFGKPFEQFLLLELMAYQAYRNPELDIRYWRTSSGYEVKFVLGEMDIAVEHDLLEERQVLAGEIQEAP